MVKTLVALATERMLLKTSGPTFLRGIEFMYAAGLAPDRLSVMMTSSHKYVLQFHSKCDIRPFAANYPNFGRVLRGIVHVREWRIKSIEFVNVAFYMRDVDNLERAIEKLGVELVLLRNCTYPGVQRGDEAVKFLSALNRKKQAVVCEYGDDRLKHRIGRRASGHRARRASRNGQDVAVVPQEAAAAAAAAPLLPPPPAVPAGIPQLIRRPVAAPVNPEPERLHGGPPLNPPRVAVPEVVQEEPRDRSRRLERIDVGAHIYEFRAIEREAAPLHNFTHLLNVLNENAGNDVRVIVVPSRSGSIPIENVNNVNNNDNFGYRQLDQQQAHVMNGIGGLPVAPMNGPNAPLIHHFVAPIPGIRDGAAGRMAVRQNRPRQFDQAQLMVQPGENFDRGNRNLPQPVWNASPDPIGNQPVLHQQYQAHIQNVPIPAANNGPIPMFGDAVNEAQVQRNGDDSNDSTDREDHQEMDDADQQQRREEALRDLVADPEAQPNFAPVEANAVDLDMLEEDDEEEVMEGVVVAGQYLIDEQPAEMQQ